jgi:hypothetical protein
MSASSLRSLAIGISPLVAVFASFFILPAPHSHVPAFVVFASFAVCLTALCLGFFGSVVLAFKHRKLTWLLVTAASIAACGASFSIAFQGFNPGH